MQYNLDRMSDLLDICNRGQKSLRDLGDHLLDQCLDCHYFLYFHDAEVPQSSSHFPERKKTDKPDDSRLDRVFTVHINYLQHL